MCEEVKRSGLWAEHVLSWIVGPAQANMKAAMKSAVTIVFMLLVLRKHYRRLSAT